MTSAPASPSPSKIRPSGGLGIFITVFVAVVAIGATAILFFFNPSTHGFYPVCLFHEVTGWNCPCCGATRASYALLHGHFGIALQDNALFVVIMAAIAMRGGWFLAAKRSGRPARTFVSANVLWGLLVVTVVFS